LRSLTLHNHNRKYPEQNQVLNGKSAREISSPSTKDREESPTTMTERITEPHENDILMGRGGKNNQHIGNEKLRSMAREQSENYRMSSKKGKSYISRELVRRVRQLSPPGRFLKKNNITGDWEDVGDEVAREKASQVLRDAVSATMTSTSNASDTELDKSMEDISNEHRRSASAPPIIMGDRSKASRRRREWEETSRSPPPHHHRHHHHHHRYDRYPRDDVPHHPYDVYSRPPPHYYPPRAAAVTPGSGESTAKRRRYYHTRQSWDERMTTRSQHPQVPHPSPDAVRSASYSGRSPEMIRSAPYMNRTVARREPEAPLMGDVQSGLDEFDLFNGELLRDSDEEEADGQVSDLQSDTF